MNEEWEDLTRYYRPSLQYEGDTTIIDVRAYWDRKRYKRIGRRSWRDDLFQYKKRVYYSV